MMKTSLKAHLFLLAALAAPLPALAQTANPYTCNWGNASQCDLNYAYSCANGDTSGCDKYNASYAAPGKEITPQTPFEDVYRQSATFQEQQNRASQFSASDTAAQKQAEAQNYQATEDYQAKLQATADYQNSDEYKQKTAAISAEPAQQGDDDDPCAMFVCLTQTSLPKECRKPIEKWESIRKRHHGHYDAGRTKTARAKKLYSCDGAKGENKSKADTIIETWGPQPYILEKFRFN
jgi:hypothetical protein